ncbi:DUF6470 family protein [Fusibacter ferrireducens]|uniref:Uncharacterized protein n=1 Tax=Fusibacter ferrireducens TaxID=2785058 RepID=A0ABR9ZVQ8_9FIRM|nr:DUF6470 family protein [Fusibacter ferrireducens]MBF4694505.1 hypothetical protein [Fusibacter ferrireducens]
MAIEINTTPMIIDWNVKQGNLEQSGNGKKVLSLETQEPELEMESEQPKISIDQTECFSEVGLKNIKAFMDDAVSYGMQALQLGIDRIVQDGNSWSDIHINNDPIPDQAERNAYELFQHEFNYAGIPTSRPKIELIKGDINYNVKRGQVSNQTQSEKVKMDYTPWEVNYFVKQYSSIQFRFQRKE